MKICIVALAAVTSAVAFAAGSSTVDFEGYCIRVVRSGETVESPPAGNVVGTINHNAKPATGPYEGSKPAVLLEDGAKLTVSGTSDGNAATFWPMVLMTNGTATIDVSGCRIFKFPRYVILAGGAKLVINADEKLEYVGLGHPYYVPYMDIRGLSVVKNGEDMTGCVRFHSDCRVLSMPDNWRENYMPSSVENGKTFFLQDVYEGVTDITNFPSTQVYVVSPDFINGKKVKLGLKTSLHLTPFEITRTYESIADYLFTSDNENQLGHISFGLTGTNYAFNLEFTDSTASLVIDADSVNGDPVGSSFSGNVSGPGTFSVVFGPGANSVHPKYVNVDCDFSEFTGTLSTYCENRSSLQNKLFGYLVVSTSNDLVDATVSVGAHVKTVFSSPGRTVNIKAVEGLSLWNSFFGAEEGTELSVGSLSGLITPVDGGDIVCGGIVPFSAVRNVAAVEGAPEATATARDADGEIIASAYYDGDLEVIDIGEFTEALVNPAKYNSIRIATGKKPVNVPSGVPLETDGHSFDMTAAEHLTVSGSGSLDFRHIEKGDWTNSVNYWFDFSDPQWPRRVNSDDPESEYYNQRIAWTSTYKGVKCPVIERCTDRRLSDDAASLWQGLAYYTLTDQNSVSEGYFPILVTNMYERVPGLSYLSFGDRTTSRLPFAYNRAGAVNGGGISVQYVVMVYGSRLGGGESLVADGNSLFKRQRKGSDGVIHPFISTNSLPEGVEIRADGKKIDEPWVTCPNGDWQVVTIKMNGQSFRGLGFYGTNKVNGNGQSEYGEILLFTGEVSELDVLQVERYLAEKWNLPYDTSDVDAAVQAVVESVTNTVSGVGPCSVRINSTGYSTLKLAGNMSGEIVLDGGKLVVDGNIPWTEEQVAAVDGRCFWFDPDDASSVKLVSNVTKYKTELSRTQIRAVKNKTDPDFRSGPLMVGISNRMPYLRNTVRRFGPVRGWADFYEWQKEENSGNMLRMISAYEGDDWEKVSNVPYKHTVQTILFAHDSTHGGGMPVNDTGGGNGLFAYRTTWNPADKVWNGSKCTEFRDGLNRIDGVTQTNPNGFGGKPEVYTVRGTNTIEAQYYIDFYKNSEYQSTIDDPCAACVGEMLYFSTALDDSTISGIESYLMGKWLGVLPAGFGDARAATVSGSGTVEVADISMLPNIAPDFNGTVKVAGESGEMIMTVDAATRKVCGAIVNSGAGFYLPESVTVRVRFSDTEESCTRYRYTLVDADVSGIDNWTFDLSDPSVPKGASIVRQDDRVYLVVTVIATRIIVR